MSRRMAFKVPDLSSQAAGNEVFAALANETLHEGWGGRVGQLSRGLLGNF